MNEQKGTIYEEKNIGGGQYGVPLLILGVILLVACVPLIIFGAVQMGESWRPGAAVLGGAAIGLGIAMPIVGLVLLCGLKVVKPNEALVLTLFGKYYGTLKGAGFYFVNPFCTAVNPTVMNMQDAAEQAAGKVSGGKVQKKGDRASGKAISLKAITLDNGKQKINDAMGNPIEIGIVVIWRVVNTAKAVFSVDNYMDFLSIQADSALRNIVRLYPYDVSEEGDELSLRGSSQEVAERLKTEIQQGGAGGLGSVRGTHHPSGLRAGDCSSNAAAPAGRGDHRRPQDDCGRCGGHGDHGAGKTG